MASIDKVEGQFRRQLPIRVINAMGELLARMNLYDIKIDPSSIVASAQSRSGPNALDDNNIHEPLEVLTKSINQEAGLDFFGRFLVRDMLVGDLSNRMRVLSVANENKAIEEASINRPIFIVGFPRTGTTMLHHLLALDESNRTPRMWETLSPAPSNTRDGRIVPPLVEQARKFIKAIYFMSPQVPSIHALHADGPDECLKLLENTFVSPHFQLLLNVPAYWDWLLSEKNQDFSAVYKFHRKQLQVLNWYEPGERWILKTPIHLFFLESLLKVYPDAYIIHLHRDPHIAIPSFCSLVAANRAIFYAQQSSKELGKMGVDVFKVLNDRAIDYRKLSSNNNQFIDVSYNQLVKEPIGTVRKIYHHFNLDYSAANDKKINHWLRHNPKNKNGIHEYSLEQFGLSPELITQSASRYLDNYSQYC